MSARTKNQRLAIDTALAVFRRTSLTHSGIRLMETEEARVAITAAMADTREGGPGSETILARIAVAYPGMQIELEGGRYHGHTWALRMATEVVFQIIHDVCGVNPVHGDRDDAWLFLGRTICADRHAPGTILPGMTVTKVELADLFVTKDGELMSVCVGGTANSTVEEVGKSGGWGSGNPNLREAARRSRLLTARLPV